MSDIPSRCIDPVIKYCQGCCYGQCVYPEWVETYEERFHIIFAQLSHSFHKDTV